MELKKNMYDDLGIKELTTVNLLVILTVRLRYFKVREISLEVPTIYQHEVWMSFLFWDEMLMAMPRVLICTIIFWWLHSFIGTMYVTFHEMVSHDHGYMIICIKENYARQVQA